MIIGKNLLEELFNFLKIKSYDCKKNISCPIGIHEDKNPSFSIDLSKQVYFCHSCKSKGTLANLYELLLKKEIEVDVETNSIAGKEYLEIDEKFYLPVIDFLSSENLRQNYIKAVKSRCIPITTLDILTNYVCNDNTSNFYGYWCFEHDIDNDFICARLLIESKERTKYLYKKGIPRYILGISFLDYSIDYCIIVEGIFDWFTLKYLGFNNVLCSFGTSIKLEELYKIKDKFESCLIVFDNDFAGFSGAKKVSENLSTFNIKSKIANLPNDFGKDINNALQLGLNNSIIEFINKEIALLPKKEINIDNFNQVEWLEKNYFNNSNNIKVIKTGLNIFDNLTGGIKPGCITLLGASSQGKTAFAIFLAKSIVNFNTCKIAYITCEISMAQVWSRILSSYSQYSWVALEEDYSLIKENDKSILKKYAESINVFSSISIDKCIEMIDNYDVIFLDYIQVATTTSLEENESKRLQSQFALMSNIGVNKNKTFIILSAISQQDYGKAKSIKVKGSGGGDYSAYMTLCLNKQINESKESYLELYIQKNTRGISGVSCYFLADFSKNNFFEIENPNRS